MASRGGLRELWCMDRRELLVQPAAPSPASDAIDARKFWREQRKARRPTKISIVIPAHNEAAYLPRTLAALRRQHYPGLEIVVVANGCTDDTPDVAHGACDRLVVLSQKNLRVARNRGARIASGELLAFVDADTVLAPGALKRIAERFNARDAAGRYLFEDRVGA